MPSPQVLASSAFAAPQPSLEGPCHPPSTAPLPPSPHPSLCFESEGLHCLQPPISIKPKARGSREGQRLPGWSMGWGWVPSQGACSSHCGLCSRCSPASSLLYSKQQLSSNKGFQMLCGRHEGCGHSSSLGGVGRDL
ncbi:unnamed protein product [Rangifer tarandus platyrhynchus]|uniref:Uncharacterized protein n=2 Tax=Rangifer tarandus platyrhynchus TaxID=3082113 RepID=A0AC59ZHK0_RANTA|nr:unnamed protein product [Rangifer tarandus platyrhynchus]